MPERLEKVLVLGVGNILLRDEGVGVRAIEYLQERERLPSFVDLVDGGTAGLSLIELLKKYQDIIIIDALIYNGEPGSIYRMTDREISKTAPMMATAHEIGVREILAMTNLEGYSPNVIIIGVEPKEISPGLDLSPVVSNKLPAVSELLFEELERLELENTTNKHKP